MHPAYLTTGRAFPHRIWRGLYSFPVQCCRHPPGIRPELRLLARFATQELGPRRRRGQISAGPSLMNNSFYVRRRRKDDWPSRLSISVSSQALGFIAESTTDSTMMLLTKD